MKKGLRDRNTDTHTERKRDDKKSNVKRERGQRVEARKSLGQRKESIIRREAERGAQLQKLREREKR